MASLLDDLRHRPPRRRRARRAAWPTPGRPRRPARAPRRVLVAARRASTRPGRCRARGPVPDGPACGTSASPWPPPSAGLDRSPAHRPAGPARAPARRRPRRPHGPGAHARAAARRGVRRARGHAGADARRPARRRPAGPGARRSTPPRPAASPRSLGVSDALPRGLAGRGRGSTSPTRPSCRSGPCACATPSPSATTTGRRRSRRSRACRPRPAGARAPRRRPGRHPVPTRRHGSRARGRLPPTAGPDGRGRPHRTTRRSR